MLLSIIVPVYNVEAYVSRCIDSLINQDIDANDFEIILVNDGSTDSSLSILQNYANAYDHIKIINQKNKGLSSARNSGVTHSLGTYIYFVDSDDYIEKHILNTFLKLIVKYNLDFLGFDFTNTTLPDFKLNLNPKDIADFDNRLKISDGCTFISDNNYYNNAWWYIFKKDLVIKNNIKFVEGIMLEDGIYTTELLLHCQKATHIPLSIYRYFTNSHSIMRNTSPSHINRLNNDFQFVVTKFTNLIRLAKDKKADHRAVKRLMARQESYVFFLFVRLIKVNITFTEFKKVITEFKRINVYPIRNFIGEDYNSQKEKILTTIFNNQVFTFMLLKVNKVFKVI